jgi:hypothetical protein
LSLRDKTAEKSSSTVAHAKKVKGVAKITQVVVIAGAGKLIAMAGGTTRWPMLRLSATRYRARPALIGEHDSEA